MNLINTAFFHKLATKLWNDDCGAVLAVELALYMTILLLGIVPALIALRQGVGSELLDLANSFMALDQSYSFSGGELVCDRSNRTTDVQGNSWDLGENRASQVARQGQTVVNPTAWRGPGKTVGTQETRTDGSVQNRRSLAWVAGSAFNNRNPEDRDVNGKVTGSNRKALRTVAVPPTDSDRSEADRSMPVD